MAGPERPGWDQSISIPAPLTGRDIAAQTAAIIAYLISIPAPLTGRDTAMIFSASHGNDFNPRAPYGARLGHEQDINKLLNISIPAPLTGRDPENTP